MNTEDALRFKIQELQEINTALGRENLFLEEDKANLELKCEKLENELEDQKISRAEENKYFVELNDKYTSLLEQVSNYKKKLERYKKYMQGEDRRPYIEWTRGKLIDELERYREFVNYMKQHIKTPHKVWDLYMHMFVSNRDIEEFEGDK